MPIDLGQVDWLYVAVLAVFAFVANFVANLLSFNHRVIAAVLAAAVFTATFVFWTYYLYGLPLLPTSIAGQKSTVTAVAPLAPGFPKQTTAGARIDSINCDAVSRRDRTGVDISALPAEHGTG